jgi:hypothetical protein
MLQKKKKKKKKKRRAKNFNQYKNETEIDRKSVDCQKRNCLSTKSEHSIVEWQLTRPNS